MRALFWGSVALVGYTYIVFPALVVLRSLFRPRPVQAGASTPSASVVIAARNEERVIAQKLENLLASRYPAGCLEVVVASDGSTDRTVAAAAGFADRGVRVIDLPAVGKADALNAAVAASSGEVLVFTDANSMFAPDAIAALMRPFADPAVGGVAGDQRYLPGGPGDSAAGERRYWNLDRWLKEVESRGGNTISATGAIYAIRRDLFEPVVAGVTDDFFTSTAVVARGYRLVFAREAVAWEPVATTTGREFERKVRIMTRGLRGVVARRALLDPRRHGFYAVQLASHKLLRRLAAIPLVLAGISSLALAAQSRTYALAAAAQATVYGFGAVGLAFGDRRWARAKPFSIPAFFVMVNAAALVAAANLLLGRRIDRWDPRRDEEDKG